jgi:hypothetical protein
MFEKNVSFDDEKAETVLNLLYKSNRLIFKPPNNRNQELELQRFKSELNGINIDQSVASKLLLFDKYYIPESVFGFYDFEEKIIKNEYIGEDDLGYIISGIKTDSSFKIGLDVYADGFDFNLYNPTFEFRQELMNISSLVFAYYKHKYSLGMSLIPLNRLVFNQLLIIIADSEVYNGINNPRITKKIVKRYSVLKNMIDLFGKKVIERHLYLLHGFVGSVTNIIKRSSINNTVITHDFIKYIGNKMDINDIKKNLLYLNGEDYWFPLKVYIEEVDCFPIIRTFDEMIEIKNLKQFKKFKETIKNYQEQCLSGDLSSIDRLRNDIRLAKKDLNAKRNYEKVSGYLVVTSIPIAIAELLIGFPIISTSCALIGTGMYINSKIREKNNSWILLK